MTYLLFFLAVFPGLFLSWYIWWRDKHEREPHKYLIACFIFGMLSTIPAVFLEIYGQSLGYGAGPDIINTFIFAVVVVGFSEEFSKFLFLRYYIFPKEEFCEPMDGIVYAVMVSMGFATLENILYVFDTEKGGMQTAILRMLLSVPGHAAFAVIMGYFVGLAKFARGSRLGYLAAGLILSSLVHGLYDFFLFQQMDKALAIFTLITFVAAIIMSRFMIHWHVENSPHKDGKHL
jgi:RsiW-degrading membrane proteinase PrsW (M82 family)